MKYASSTMYTRKDSIAEELSMMENRMHLEELFYNRACFEVFEFIPPGQLVDMANGYLLESIVGYAASKRNDSLFYASMEKCRSSVFLATIDRSFDLIANTPESFIFITLGSSIKVIDDYRATASSPTVQRNIEGDAYVIMVNAVASRIATVEAYCRFLTAFISIGAKRPVKTILREKDRIDAILQSRKTDYPAYNRLSPARTLTDSPNISATQPKSTPTGSPTVGASDPRPLNAVQMTEDQLTYRRPPTAIPMTIGIPEGMNSLRLDLLRSNLSNDEVRRRTGSPRAEAIREGGVVVFALHFALEMMKDVVPIVIHYVSKESLVPALVIATQYHGMYTHLIPKFATLSIAETVDLVRRVIRTERREMILIPLLESDLARSSAAMDSSMKRSVSTDGDSMACTSVRSEGNVLRAVINELFPKPSVNDLFFFAAIAIEAKHEAFFRQCMTVLLHHLDEDTITAYVRLEQSRFATLLNVGCRVGSPIPFRFLFPILDAAIEKNLGDYKPTDAVSTDAVSTDAVSTDAVSTDAVSTKASRPRISSVRCDAIREYLRSNFPEIGMRTVLETYSGESSDLIFYRHFFNPAAYSIFLSKRVDERMASEDLDPITYLENLSPLILRDPLKAYRTWIRFRSLVIPHILNGITAMHRRMVVEACISQIEVGVWIAPQFMTSGEINFIEAVAAYENEKNRTFITEATIPSRTLQEVFDEMTDAKLDASWIDKGLACGLHIVSVEVGAYLSRKRKIVTMTLADALAYVKLIFPLRGSPELDDALYRYLSAIPNLLIDRPVSYPFATFGLVRSARFVLERTMRE